MKPSQFSGEDRPDSAEWWERHVPSGGDGELSPEWAEIAFRLEALDAGQTKWMLWEDVMEMPKVHIRARKPLP